MQQRNRKQTHVTLGGLPRPSQRAIEEPGAWDSPRWSTVPVVWLLVFQVALIVIAALTFGSLRSGVKHAPCPVTGTNSHAVMNMNKSCMTLDSSETVPFYMYDDAVMMMTHMEACDHWGSNLVYPDADGSDVAFLRLMRQHPWRTINPDEARIHIIPIPLSASWLYDEVTAGQATRCAGSHTERILKAFTRLYEHPVYQKHNRSHYLHCHHWRCLNTWDLHLMPPDLFKAGNLSNIMQGRFERFFTTPKDCQEFGDKFGICSSYDGKEFFPLTYPLRTQWETTRCVIPAPYLASQALALQRHSFEEWDARNITVFYQTRRNPSGANATALRHKPVQSAFASLPGVVVGMGDLGRDEWKRRFESAKFCLAIRGDTASTHAIYNALKVGCIPVIISNMFNMLGAPFTTTLPWSTFTITLHEEMFKSDPVATSRFLWQLPRGHLRQIYHNLLAAQDALLYPENDTAGSTLGHHLLQQLAADCL